jgi:hypothetical protein
MGGMGQDQEKTTPPPDPSGAQTEASDAFDVWLHRSLHQLYDGVTEEPIPAELLRLIEQSRKSPKKP